MLKQSNIVFNTINSGYNEFLAITLFYSNQLYLLSAKFDTSEMPEILSLNFTRKPPMLFYNSLQ